jgi:hypothetical protein
MANTVPETKDSETFASRAVALTTTRTRIDGGADTEHDLDRQKQNVRRVGEMPPEKTSSPTVPMISTTSGRISNRGYVSAPGRSRRSTRKTTTTRPMTYGGGSWPTFQILCERGGDAPPALAGLVIT